VAQAIVANHGGGSRVEDNVDPAWKAFTSSK